MTPTKPDRWERTADKIDHLCEVKGCRLRRKEVADLLRKEHAAVMRIVARCQGEIGGLIDKGELLAELKRRAK